MYYTSADLQGQTRRVTRRNRVTYVIPLGAVLRRKMNVSIPHAVHFLKRDLPTRRRRKRHEGHLNSRVADPLAKYGGRRRKTRTRSPSPLSPHSDAVNPTRDQIAGPSLNRKM
ncbi:hypothetical protein EVAR_13414_1 [Eumeta japonica]|uniref:Uncharacterized protein n=1 Tax=Eumeta variegata TaxID=151549 RepID=A0A4C1V983_EUMVA|nr:hypothetical protein EVAR_13414_1 [Eumeta japonica]